MTDKKHVDALFDNEDDAQSALIKAKILGATHCQVERFINDNDGASTASIVGVTSDDETGLGSAGSGPVFNVASRGFLNGNKTDITPQALLSCEIDSDKELEYSQLITEHGGRLY